MKKNERMRPAVEEGELDFSGKYSLEWAREYYRKHQKGSLGRRISNRWEQQMAGRALKLAGNPRSVLDLPCGTGRFWELLARDPDRELLAADYSEAMLVVAQEERPQEIVQRFRVFQSSAFDIQLPDNAVENIFCMRLLHHIGESEDRLRILKEFHRVARDSVCISMWVDGNYKAWKRQRAVKRRPKRKRFDNRFLHSRQQVESEQACLRPRDRFWDIPVPKIDSAFDNPLVPQPSWSPSTTQQLRKLVAAPYLAPNDWTPRSEAYFVFPLAQGTPGKQCGLAATGVYQPSLRSPWLAAFAEAGFSIRGKVDFLPRYAMWRTYVLECD